MSPAVSPSELQHDIDYIFKDPSLLQKALTHPSAATDREESYERLEFLGDAVAEIIVAEYLYRSSDSLNEGEMSKIRSIAASRSSMARAGRRLGLGKYLRIGKGLKKQKPYPGSIIGNAYEALLAAIYLDGGFETACSFLKRTLRPELELARQQYGQLNYKSVLQEFAQGEGKPPPAYRTQHASGPAHDALFEAEVKIDSQIYGRGQGSSKKEAEQAAARLALKHLYPDWDDVSEVD
ncbi:MAG: ribonuclease III [Candidatus Brocadiia bacterium]